MIVTGVDGCPGGWLAVRWNRAKDGDPLIAELYEGFSQLLAGEEVSAAIAIDIPIGLAARAMKGGRPCDIAARTVLGARQSAVFAVPARPAVMERDYRAACEVALNHSDPPRRISKQCFHLFAKIRDVDAVMTPDLQARVIECHPEVAFCAMNGWQALDRPKKVKSRPNPEGLALRRRLLHDQGFPLEALAASRWPASKVGPDDILDACACAWTAGRFASQTARRFPNRPGTDPHGLRMEIWG